MRNVKWVTALVAFAFMAFASSALANIVTPGGPSVTPDALTLPGTATLVATTSGSFSSSTLNGTYSESVYNTTGVPGGTLDYLLTITAGSTSQTVSEVTNGVFLPVSAGTIDAGFESGSTGTGATGVKESASDVVEWTITLAPGTSSDTLMLATGATSYTAGSIGIIDSSTATVGGFAAAAEPSSMALLGLVLLGGLLYERKKVFA